MEASALRHAAKRGLLARRSPLLRVERDERLIALIRVGHDRAFEVLFDRYQARLLAYCRSMLKSQQDAEDVLQEVFTNAHKAIVADDRKINVRPWIYRIARNRCLNHLRRPVPEGQDTMDVHPHLNGTSTAERVQKREELRQLLSDVETLPETQRSALLLREVEQLSYEEIAEAMETTIPAVKSLLVRARVALAESSEARALTCEEVRLSLAEAAEGLRKASGPIRQHVKGCEECFGFRKQLRRDHRSLAAIAPFGPIALLKHGAIAKALGGAGGSGAVAGGAGGAIGAGTTATGGLTVIGGAIGTKAAVGMATAALLTAGAVEVKHRVDATPPAAPTAIVATAPTAEPVAASVKAPPAGPATREPEFTATVASDSATPKPKPEAAKAVEEPAPEPPAAPTTVEPVVETPVEEQPAGPVEEEPAAPTEPEAEIEPEPVEDVGTPATPPEVGQPAAPPSSEPAAPPSN